MTAAIIIIVAAVIFAAWVAWEVSHAGEEMDAWKRGERRAK